MTTTTKRPSLILLREANNRQVVVTPRNNDAFVVTEEQAVLACRAHEKAHLFKTQFNGLLQLLGDWIQEHRGKLREASLTVRETDVLFLVVQKEKAFDEQLAADLTELDIEVADDAQYSLIDLEVMAIPAVTNESVKAFLSTE